MHSPDPLVSVDWLAARLAQPGIAVLDATLPPVGVVPAPDMQAAYRARHIPGAVFFDIEAFSDPGSGLPHTLPVPQAFADGMGALGLSNTMTLVVYEQGGVFSAPRAWWMLRTMGVENVFLLDGGLDAWVGAGQPVEAGEVQRHRAMFEAHLVAPNLARYEDLQETLAAGGQVLDARSAGRFAGTAPEPRPGVPSGHMPGAISLPYGELVRGGSLLEPEAARTVLEARGIDLDRPTVTTCGSGVTAAVLALALERCGAKQVRVYDGSWAEYAQMPGAVIVTGAA